MALKIRRERSRGHVGHFRSAEARRAYRAAYDEAFRDLPEANDKHDVETSFGRVRAYEWHPRDTEHRHPVILLPGRASGTPMWSANIRALGEKRRVIALDMLGDAGLSQQHQPLNQVRDHATWLHEVQSQLAPQGAHVVGHSFGGSTAAAYALHHPQSVTSLALLEPMLTLAYPPIRMLLWTALFSLPVLPARWRSAALARVGGSDDDAGALGRMVSLGVAGFRAELPMPRPLSASQLSELTMPVYAAFAERDSLAGKPGTASRVRERLPDGHVTTWPGTTHSLPLQVPAALAGDLDEFWTRAEERARTHPAAHASRLEQR
ncbi:alpha/beta fold hydrolase [Paramicrobacterium agarici]|uniref:Pimeloyl-ACP methyl ester carboxylesterase n=1 Tax=Paramicrobacterium agarici TaxID=630514 RepID=A0A2A9DZP8_9MICO|nr:alpha/beta fold hydrolase [Microbacterium agarici]PFG31856.1 pimeloyl-ACP methyl ester carboxylesterase [Microbacterium agarici]